MKSFLDNEQIKSKVTSVAFFGGEPLLNKEVMYQTVDYCKNILKLKIGYTITTNGTLIDEEFVNFAKKNKMSVGISIDGDKISHDKNRIGLNGNSTFDKTLEGCKLCINKKVDCMALPVVCKNNVNDMANNVQYLVNLGFKKITLNFNYLDDWNDEDVELLREQYEKVKEIYLQELKKNNPVKIYPIDTKIVFLLNQKAQCVDRCNLDRTCLDSDGTAYPCIQFVGKKDYQIGNYKDGIDDKKRYELIKIRNTVKNECNDCALKRYCISGCGCVRMSTTNSILEISPIICETEKIYINIANDIIGEINKMSEFVKYRWIKGE